MAEILTPDICVIGAGSGGLSVAAAARAFGASVVLVERAELGGECLYSGCVPSKALIAAGRQAHEVRGAQRFGVMADDPKINFGRLYDHVHQVIASIAPHDSVARYEAMGVTVIRAEGRFVDKRTLVAGERQIRARRFVVATGSHAAVPPLPGIDTVKYLTNETVFDETRRPSQLIIIGAGAIGLELGQAYHRLGAGVIVVEAQAPLQREDAELAAVALRRIRAEGLDIRSGLTVTNVAPRGHGVNVTVSDGTKEEVLAGSHVLVAVGRAPNVAGLDLEKAGIRFTPQGIRVDKGLRTSNRRVYAIGDVLGRTQFTHMAGYQASLVVRNALFGLPVTEKRDIVPHATYTDPELASVGLTEAEARNRRLAYRVLRWSFAENDRARTTRETEGLVKVLVDGKGTILGAGIVGPKAGELISLYAYAMANNLKIGSFLNFVAPYPTLSEVTKRVAVEFYREQVSNPWLDRLRGLVRRLP